MAMVSSTQATRESDGRSPTSVTSQRLDEGSRVASAAARSTTAVAKSIRTAMAATRSGWRGDLRGEQDTVSQLTAAETLEPL